MADETTATTVVTFTVDDISVELDLAAITGAEWRDLKRVTGLHQRQLVRDALVWEDFDAQAAFVWLAVRQEMPDVDYESVLGLFSYASIREG